MGRYCDLSKAYDIHKKWDIYTEVHSTASPWFYQKDQKRIESTNCWLWKLMLIGVISLYILKSSVAHIFVTFLENEYFKEYFEQISDMIKVINVSFLSLTLDIRGQ